MPLLSVIADRCKRDGICAEICPMGIIALKEKDGFPELVQGAEAFCIRCGHCVAVCPHAAMNHSDMPADRCPPLRKELLPDSGQAEHFLRARRSIRTYKQQSVDRELLSRLIHVARYAPSGHNMQPVEWLVIYDSRKVFDLAGLVIDWMRHLVGEGSPLVELLHLDRLIERWDAGQERIFRRAPHIIIAHAHKDNRTAQAAGTIALSYLELMAPPLGLGTCWAGYFTAAAANWPPVMEALALPKEYAVFGTMMVGYPKYRYHRLPERKQPKISWR
jgi:nitroreductase/NAD-dependent dihydropyrimidine dehydrogenase PreA subunit